MNTSKEWLPLNWGIPFSLVAVTDSDLGRFAVLEMIQDKQARGFGKPTFICQPLRFGEGFLNRVQNASELREKLRGIFSFSPFSTSTMSIVRINQLKPKGFNWLMRSPIVFFVIFGIKNVRFFYNVTSTVKSRTHTVWEAPDVELLDSTKIIENFCYKNRKHQYYKAPAKKSDNSTRLKLSKKGEAR